MAENSKIEWCDSTWNPWVGCTKVSPGCDNCYAEAWDRRFAVSGHWGAGKARRRTSASNWRLPVRWNAAHEAFFAEHGRRRRVFCASLADVFDNEVPEQWRVDLFRLIEATPNLGWILLTKRIGNAADMMFMARGGHLPLLPNVWIGATVVNQEEADRDVPKLLATPAAVRFLSIEPMLGPVDLQTHFAGHCPEHDFASGFCIDRKHRGVQHLHWIIVGGESGPKARPMHPDWARSLRDQCNAASVPFFLKQMGGVRDKRGALEDLPEDLRTREYPHANT